MLAPSGGVTLCPWRQSFFRWLNAVGFGSSVSFWNDPWDLGTLKDHYPHLFSFSRNKSCSVLQWISWDVSRAFFLPLSQIAFDQPCALKEALLALQLPLLGADVWTYTWGSDFLTQL
jgi:hypothetical protein